MDSPQFGQRFDEVFHLVLQMTDLLKTFLRGQLKAPRCDRAILDVDHLTDLGERETEILCPEDEADALAVTLTIGTRSAVATR